MTKTTLPPEIHERMMANNPQYRSRHERRERARKQGRTESPKTNPNP